jgi:hypothetical protein
MDKKTIFAVVVFSGGAVLYYASDWWERAYAKYESSEISPDGCIRIDTFEPFRVLPSVFHRIPHPDPSIRHRFGMQWDAAIFRRAYEVSTGVFLGETVVYDPMASFNLMFWNEARRPGRRIVLSDGFPLLDSDRCADEATLAKLEAFYEREREANQPIVDAWEDEHRSAKALP